jgi:hypothetical protein
LEASRWHSCHKTGLLKTRTLADDVNLLGDSINTIKENRETLLEASRDIGIEINAEDKAYDYVSSYELRTEPEYKDG